MVKATGSICVLLSAAWVWRQSILFHRRRVETLWAMAAALRQLGETVRIARTPLPVLLASLAEGSEGEAASFFQTAADLLRQGTAVPWKDLAGTLPLPPAAQRTLSTFGGALRGDETAVCRAAELATRQLADYARQLEQKQQEEEKQITALCFSAAALIVILLI